LVGAVFEVYNNTGFGMPEKYVQAAYAEELNKLGIKFERELYLKLKYSDKTFIKQYADFRVDDKIIIELKVRTHLGYVHIKQVQAYLRQRVINWRSSFTSRKTG